MAEHARNDRDRDSRRGRDSGPSGLSSDQTRAWAMAMQIVYGLVGAGVVGFGIDLLAGTSPWFTIGLGAAGLISGVARFIVQAIAMNRAAAERYGRAQAARPPADRSDRERAAEAVPRHAGESVDHGHEEGPGRRQGEDPGPGSGRSLPLEEIDHG